MGSRKEIFSKIYLLVRNIPKGKVLTYGLVADLLEKNFNFKVSPRVVGFALHRNKDNKKVPCHRVVFADGSLSLSFAFGGEKEQRKKLKAEGVVFDEDGKVNLEKSLWQISGISHRL